MNDSSNNDGIRFVQAGGEDIPALGLGTWQLEGDGCVTAVADALALGYRHIDTAEAYENEEEVGRGIRRADVDRDDVFVTTKVWWKELEHHECIAAAEESLTKLGLSHIDLLLIHWPDESVPLDEPLEAMSRLLEQGKIRHMGVSNFTPSLLEEALEMAPVICNQVEYHPFLAQDRLLDICQENDLMLTAYSPLAQAKVNEDPVLRGIAHAHGKTPAQVALRWLLQQEQVAAIPRSASSEHRRENYQIFDFSLDDDEMDTIADLDEGLRLIDPDFAPDWERPAS